MTADLNPQFLDLFKKRIHKRMRWLIVIFLFLFVLCKVSMKPFIPKIHRCFTFDDLQVRFAHLPTAHPSS